VSQATGNVTNSAQFADIVPATVRACSAAPRLDLRLLSEIDRQDDGRASFADIWRAVGECANRLGQPRPSRRGEARGAVVYSADETSMRIETYIWRDDDWGLTAVRTFPRGREPLAVERPV